MALLSNKGRVIPSLDNYSNPTAKDLLVIQDITNNQTKNITLSQLATKVTSLVQDTTVNYTSDSNVFTGSFYSADVGNTHVSFKGGFFSGSTAKFDKSLTISNEKLVVDANQFHVTGVPSVLFSTISGNEIVFDSNTQFNSNVDVSKNVTSLGGFTGSIKGDVYSLTGNKVLENGNNLAKDSLFYGTSSYAKTSSYVTGKLIGNVIGHVDGSITGYVTAGNVYSTTNKIVLENSSDLAKNAHFYGTSSHATNATNAINAVSAQIADNINPNIVINHTKTSSFVLYNGLPNGKIYTAEYASQAINAGYANSSGMSSFAYQSNTASYILAHKVDNLTMINTAEFGFVTSSFSSHDISYISDFTYKLPPFINNPSNTSSFASVIVIGGGGSGGGYGSSNSGGGGGGGGMIMVRNIKLLFGKTYNIKIGIGGSRVNSNVNGNNGEMTSITGDFLVNNVVTSLTIAASGGKGGGSGTNGGGAKGCGGTGSVSGNISGFNNIIKFKTYSGSLGSSAPVSEGGSGSYAGNMYTGGNKLIYSYNNFTITARPFFDIPIYYGAGGAGAGSSGTYSGCGGLGHVLIRYIYQ